MVVKSERKRPPPDEFGPAPVPNTRDLGRLSKAAKSCRACPLWRNATCVVFGKGEDHARVVLVGEQPGDQEDRAGEPFVGPAGMLLDRALAAAGVDRRTLYRRLGKYASSESSRPAPAMNGVAARHD